MQFVLGDYLEMVYRQLEAMPGGRDTELSELERVAYARRAAPIASIGDYNAAMLALIDRGGFRPSPLEFGEIVKKSLGLTEIDDLPPAQREMYRTDRSRAAEEARVRAEQEQRSAQGERLLPGNVDPYYGDEDGRNLGLPPLLPGETCRERARRMINTLVATSKGGPLASSLTALTKAVDAAGVYDNFTEGDTDEWAP